MDENEMKEIMGQLGLNGPDDGRVAALAATMEQSLTKFQREFTHDQQLVAIKGMAQMGFDYIAHVNATGARMVAGGANPQKIAADMYFKIGEAAAQTLFAVTQMTELLWDDTELSDEDSERLRSLLHEIIRTLSNTQK